MTGEPHMVLALASFALMALSIASLAALKGWRGWLELKHVELARAPGREPAVRPSSPAARIELADLRERVRKLEAIASGVEL